MFTPQQLLSLTLLHRSIAVRLATAGNSAAAEAALSAFQQVLRLNNQFTIWHMRNNQTSAFLSNPNYQPKATFVETFAFASVGDGSWASAVRGLFNGLDWKDCPWELVSNEELDMKSPLVTGLTSGKTTKCFPNDLIGPVSLHQASATDLSMLANESQDLVVTDPPFGNLVQYAELADFFYVWLRLSLSHRYTEEFGFPYSPKTLEVVENPARTPDGAAQFYQRLLTAAWSEACRVLKPSGLLAFTFHHSEDDPWVQVLESLFDAGFYLAATYPIRCDEIKADGEFGSNTVEYDIIHVCRKRTFTPSRVSWAKMRREILREVKGLQDLLEHHRREGLPAADIEVIKRGKALEYYSRHYGEVYHAEGERLGVKDALLGVVQVLDEDGTPGVELPPVNASPYTRQLLRMFRDGLSLDQNQVQKWLRGTGTSPSEYEDRGWIKKVRKEYHLLGFLEVAQSWQRKHRVGMVQDYDQAAFLVGACFESSGIKAEETLSNPSFKPHPALGSLLEWFATRSKDPKTRTAAGRAERLFRTWQTKHQAQTTQLKMFADPGADG